MYVVVVTDSYGEHDETYSYSTLQDAVKLDLPDHQNGILYLADGRGKMTSIGRWAEFREDADYGYDDVSGWRVGDDFYEVRREAYELMSDEEYQKALSNQRTISFGGDPSGSASMPPMMRATGLHSGAFISRYRRRK